MFHGPRRPAKGDENPRGARASALPPGFCPARRARALSARTFDRVPHGPAGHQKGLRRFFKGAVQTYFNEPTTRNTGTVNESGVLTQARGTWPIPAITDAEFARFRALIRKETGIHLKEHKRHLLVARLAQRLRELGLRSFSAYYEHLTGDRSGREMSAFINRVTTNKTSFFREPHHFEFLRDRLIPHLRHSGSRRLRLWSAGCSSGEEPYSMAMILAETLGKTYGWDVRILATDIDTEVLAQAQSGTYDLRLLEGVSLERRRAHFLRGYGEFAGLAQVKAELRRLVDFRRMNFNDPEWEVHGDFDAIFCRNVIIYFDQSLQQRIVERLAAHLNPGGYFFAGHSENLFWAREVLTPVQPTVYRRNTKGQIA